MRGSFKIAMIAGQNNKILHLTSFFSSWTGLVFARNPLRSQIQKQSTISGMLSWVHIPKKFFFFVRRKRPAWLCLKTPRLDWKTRRFDAKTHRKSETIVASVWIPQLPSKTGASTKRVPKQAEKFQKKLHCWFVLIILAFFISDRFFPNQDFVEPFG